MPLSPYWVACIFQGGKHTSGQSAAWPSPVDLCLMPRAVQQLKSKGERCCSARSISDFGGGSSNVGASSSMMKELESAIRGVALAAATVPRTSGTAILARNIMCYFHHTEIRTSRNHGDLSEPHPKVMHAMDIGGIAVALAISQNHSEKEQDGVGQWQKSCVTRTSTFYNMCKKHWEMLNATREEICRSPLQF